MAETLTVIVEPGGRASFVHDDRLAALFAGSPQETRRASHVEPCGGGLWDADMRPVGGPASLGPFGTRRAALQAEVAWLERRMVHGPLEKEAGR